MIIWQGGGLAVPVVGFAWLLLGQWAVESVLGEGYWSANTWPLLLVAVCAAGSLWWLGRRLNGGGRQTLIDADSGLEFGFKPSIHSFFFVPVEWAGLMIGLLIAAIAFMK